MILAAPLVIPFAEAVGISIATLGMAKAADMVNDYIQENPEESMKILSTIVPNIGIGQIFANKEDSGDDEEVEVEEDTRSKKEIVLEELGKEKGNYSDEDAEGKYSSKRGRIIRALEDAGKVNPDREYNPEKKYQGYKRFIRPKKADGGAIGIEVLFEEKKPRKNFFMGGPALTGQPLAIYNSMSAYNSFTDQEIANAIKEAGYELPTADSGTTPPGSTPGNNLGYQSGNERQGGIMDLDPYNRQTTPMNPNSFLGKTFSKIGDFAGSIMDKFSGTKIGEGITSGATKFKNMAFTPMMALAQKRNPLNPGASNYNPSLQGQIDMLEGITGSRITGTSGNLKTTDGLAMIGRDPNSGLAKYGPGSVLSGQNVVSGFGTNDYEKQLQNYIDKMISRRTTKTLSQFQDAKLKAAKAELKAEQERQAQATLASKLAAAQREIKAKGYKDYGQGAASQATQDSYAGSDGSYAGQGEASDWGGGEKDGGIIGYRKGGLATMFKEKR